MLRLTQSDWCIRENSSRYRVAILLRFFCAAAMLYFLMYFLDQVARLHVIANCVGFHVTMVCLTPMFVASTI